MSGKMNTEKETRSDEPRKKETEKGPYNEKNATYKDTMEQNKCTVCGRTFSTHSELKDHYKTAHNMEAPEKTHGRDDSSVRGQTANRGEEEKRKKDEEEKMKEGSSNMGSKSTWSETKDRESSQKKGDTTMGKSYGSVTDPKTKTQYTCQRCGEKCSSQEELDRHNREVHGVEPGKKEEGLPKPRY
jgi:uncharacterized Zn-finger protein